MNIATGYLQVETFLANRAIPMKHVMVRIYKKINQEIVYEDFFMTNSGGKTPQIPLYAPSRNLSTDQTQQLRPYEQYHVELRCRGFHTQVILGVQIFAGESSCLPIALIPTIEDEQIYHTDIIPEHPLRTNYQGNYISEETEMGALSCTVTIPTYITVHLGLPSDAQAENITVPFLDYMKNCVSSQLYPTWSKEALKAHALVQTSFALNRIQTQWYPKQGYAFDITNSPLYDMAYVKNRNIFSAAADTVEDVFGLFIQQGSHPFSYSAPGKDGKFAHDQNLSLWESQKLADSGCSYLNILQTLYGMDINIQQAVVPQDLQCILPPVPLHPEDKGEGVMEAQRQLKAIAINYEELSEPPLNGVYGPDMEDAVRKFQRLCGLVADGIIGKKTSLRLFSLFQPIEKMQEIRSLCRKDIPDKKGSDSFLEKGATGGRVKRIQIYLSALSLFYPEIPPIKVSGIYDEQTVCAVQAFQRHVSLYVDGRIGLETEKQLYKIYLRLYPLLLSQAAAIPSENEETDPRKGTIVLYQKALNLISAQYPAIAVVTEDGLYDEKMKAALTTFQRIFDLPVSGELDACTCTSLMKISKSIKQGDIKDLPLFPGVLLRLKSSCNAVLFMQYRLNLISIYYKEIPACAVDSIYGQQTMQTVTAFQRMLGICADGIIHEQTWTLINRVYAELMGQR